MNIDGDRDTKNLEGDEDDRTRRRFRKWRTQKRDALKGVPYGDRRDTLEGMGHPKGNGTPPIGTPPIGTP